MSAGKRLAKRSIVGTRVGALYKETGYYHPGSIIAVKNPEDPSVLQLNGQTVSTGHTSGITPNSRYVVKFESTGDVREYGETDLIGPGFKPMSNLKLRSGQKIYITYNGREVQGTVVYHQPAKDEVLITIQPQQLASSSTTNTNNPAAGSNPNGVSSPVEFSYRTAHSFVLADGLQFVDIDSGQCSAQIPIPIDVTKKLDEVRLIESRKSARLLEQDFDFARLADVAERKRTGSSSSGGSSGGAGHSVIVSANNFNGTNQQLQQSMMTSTVTASIDVPRTNLSRKRRPSSGMLFQPVPIGLMQAQQSQSQSAGTGAAEVDGTDECAAAMVLMSLSCSPHSPHWDSNGMISSSWSSSSSGASSWLSNASFGTTTNGIVIPPGGGTGTGIGSLSSRHSSSSHSNHSQRSSSSPAGGEFHHINNFSPTPSSSDDGIESDNGGTASVGGLTISGSAGGAANDVFLLGWPGSGGANVGAGNGDEPRKKKTKLIFKCTWPGCTMMKDSCFEIEAHVRYAHLGPQPDAIDDHEEEFYYTEIEAPVTSSSSDFALSSSCSSSSPLGLNFMAFSPTLSHMDMVRPPSEDPEYKLSQLHNSALRKSPNGTGNTHHFNASNNPKKRLSPKSSPVRRPRGDTKKCRKVYGMDHRELWCTQCKWKKACTRFSD